MNDLFKNLSKTQQTNLLLGVVGIVAAGLAYYVIFEKNKQPEQSLERKSLASAAFIAGPEKEEKQEDKTALYKKEELEQQQAERLASENVAQKAFFGGGPKEPDKEEITAQEKLDRMNAALNDPEKNQVSVSPTSQQNAQPSVQQPRASSSEAKPTTSVKKPTSKKIVEPVVEEPAPVKSSFYTVKKSSAVEQDQPSDPGFAQGVRAIVHNEQTVHQGDVLRIRILDPLVVNGIELKENTILYGSVSFSRNRVMVKFVNAQIAGKLIALNKTAFGTDGMEGLLVGELGASSEVANNAINDGIATTTRALTGSRVLSSASRSVVKERKDEKVTLPNEFQFVIK